MLAQQRAFGAQASTRPAAVNRVRLSVFARESRIGSKPVPVPKDVTVTIDGLNIKVKVATVPSSCDGASQLFSPMWSSMELRACCRALWGRWSTPSTRL